jgi:hypothetical protein
VFVWSSMTNLYQYNVHNYKLIENINGVELLGIQIKIKSG